MYKIVQTGGLSEGQVYAWCDAGVFTPDDIGTVKMMSLFGTISSVKAIFAQMIANIPDIRAFHADTGEELKSFRSTVLNLRRGDHPLRSVSVSPIANGIVHRILVVENFFKVPDGLTNFEPGKEKEIIIYGRTEAEAIQRYFCFLDAYSDFPLDEAWAEWLWKELHYNKSCFSGEMNYDKALSIFAPDLADIHPEKNCLRKAYRRLSGKYHPNYGGNTEIMKQISLAYNLLEENGFSIEKVIKAVPSEVIAFGMPEFRYCFAMPIPDDERIQELVNSNLNLLAEILEPESENPNTLARTLEPEPESEPEKEFWQMTPTEYLEKYYSLFSEDQECIRIGLDYVKSSDYPVKHNIRAAGAGHNVARHLGEHATVVIQAKMQNKPVPEDVKTAYRALFGITESEPDDLWGEPVSVYTRRNAIDDGVLIDLSETAEVREAGIKFPLAVTIGVYHILKPSEKLRNYGQSFEGRLWDMLSVFRLEAKRSGGDTIHFAPLFLTDPRKSPKPVRMWSRCHPGDNSEPVITVMLEGED